MLKTCKFNKGISLLEVLIAITIFSAMMAAVYSVLTSGQATWFEIDARIDLDQSVRLAMDRMVNEIRETGFDKNDIAQFLITEGGGANGSDIIRFSIPVICHTGDNLIDVNGEVAHWGAPLRWGCRDLNCMDADDNCLTVEYKYVEYRLDNQNRILRRVLNEAQSVAQEDVIAYNVTDFQVSSSGAPDYLINLSLAAQKRTALNRLLTTSAAVGISLRNRG